MKTDQVIYEFLATGPEACRVLTAGLTLTGDYAFRFLWKWGTYHEIHF